MRAGMTLLLLAGVLAAQTAGTDPKGAIRGTVRDTTGLAISGTTIEAVLGAEPSVLITSNGHAVRMAGKTATLQTGKAGEYAFADLAPGNYFLRTERDPDSSAYRQVKVDAGQEVTLDLVVPAKPSISGHVFDQNGDPVVRAFVTVLTAEYRAGVLRPMLNGPQVTKHDGAYSFQFGLEANRRYYVFVNRDPPHGLPNDLPSDQGDDREPIEVPTYYPSAIGMESADTIILQPGEQREKVDIKIASAPFYCIDGRIQRPGHFTIHEMPLAGTRLVRLGGSADDEGKYHICGVSPGQYQLSADNAFTEFTVSGSDLQHVDLSADPAHLHFERVWEDPPVRQDPNSDETLHRFAALLGLGDAPIDDDLRRLAARVASGNPAANDLVVSLAARLNQTPDQTAGKLAAVAAQLFPMPPLVNATLTPLTAGNPFSLSGSGEIPPGDYSVDFHTFANAVAYPKDLTFNGVQLVEGKLRLAPGTAGTLHVVMARDTATIGVAVTDSDGKPVPHATVVLIPNSVTSAPQLSRDSVHGMADQNGSYTSPPLAPGKYRVLATAQTVRWGVPEDLERVLLVLFQAKDVEVAPKAAAQIKLEPVPIY